jgi:hypothetical protein
MPIGCKLQSVRICSQMQANTEPKQKQVCVQLAAVSFKLYINAHALLAVQAQRSDTCCIDHTTAVSASTDNSFQASEVPQLASTSTSTALCRLLSIGDLLGTSTEYSVTVVYFYTASS